ncbi:hypothetical protein SESBI_46192 [Sesbania bispinosa]|nr:hypothetical protein SESBI_46192 [Sesbania bispinosa]
MAMPPLGAVAAGEIDDEGLDGKKTLAEERKKVGARRSAGNEAAVAVAAAAGGFG